MNRSCVLAACFWLMALGGLPAGPARAGDDELLGMIVELVGSPDADMRLLGLQQVREEAPGKAATRRFAALLPDLGPAVQVQLIDALGDRGDDTARPGVLAMLAVETEAVRAAALRALARIGTADDGPALARMAASGSDMEREAARGSLRRLRARGAENALVKALADADAPVRVELIGALVDRGAEDAMPGILKHAEDPLPAVRLAVLEALRAMADHRQTEAIVNRLKAAADKAEQRQAELALLAACSRSRAKSAPAVIDGFDGAEAPARVSLVRALGEAGGAKSLAALVERLKDDDPDVAGEAVRVLTGWTDLAAVPYLEELAADTANLRNHVLAIRGLARLAGPSGDRPADPALLAGTLKLASRPPEKILLLGTLGTIATPGALALATSALQDPALLEDAALAAVNIAEKVKGMEKDALRTVLQKVADSTQNPSTRDRAATLLKSL